VHLNNNDVRYLRLVFNTPTCACEYVLQANNYTLLLNVLTFLLVSHDYACDLRRLTILPDTYKTAQGQCGMCTWRAD